MGRFDYENYGEGSDWRTHDLDDEDRWGRRDINRQDRQSGGLFAGHGERFETRREPTSRDRAGSGWSGWGGEREESSDRAYPSRLGQGMGGRSTEAMGVGPRFGREHQGYGQLGPAGFGQPRGMSSGYGPSGYGQAPGGVRSTMGGPGAYGSEQVGYGGGSQSAYGQSAYGQSGAMRTGQYPLGQHSYGEYRATQNLGQGWDEGQERDDSALSQIGHRIGSFVKGVFGGERRPFRGPKGYTRSDERIREDVSDALANLGEADPSDVEVAVTQGIVTLAGTVPLRHWKHLMEDAAENVSGVKDVVNNIRVKRDDITTSSEKTSDLSTSTNVRRTPGDRLSHS